MNHPDSSSISVQDVGERKNVQVSDSEGLNTALENAEPGHIIRLEDGTYSGDFILTKSGEADNPIVVRAKNRGKAVFNASLFIMNGHHSIIKGMIFDNGQVTVQGNHNRVSQNVFKNGKPGGNDARLNSAVRVEGSNNRVDHNEVANWQRRGLRVVPNKENSNQGKPKDNRIDHNYLHDFSRVGNDKSNAGDALQIGSNAKHTMIDTATIMDHNLVERAEADGELLSVKSSGSIIRFNTFRDSDATVQIRHGTNNKLIGNTVSNMKAMSVYGDDNEVIGNDLQNAALIINSGDITQSQLANGNRKGHPAAKNTYVAGNKVVGSFIGVGTPIPRGTRYTDVMARNTRLVDNEGQVKFGEHSDTENPTTLRGSIPQAVEVTQNNVGPDGNLGWDV